MTELALYNSSVANQLQEENEPISEMDELQKLNVWGESQEVLEEQALRELEILNNASTATIELEDDGIHSDEFSNNSKVNVDLDINSYIKRQEELKKQQQYKRSLAVSEHSKAAARKQYASLTSKSKKRKAQNDSVRKSKKQRSSINSDESCSGSEYVPSDDCLSSGEETIPIRLKTVKKAIIDKVKDDGCIKFFKLRLDEYYRELELIQSEQSEDTPVDVQISGTLKVPYKMWNNLYSYQQKGVKWLWKIHQQSSGGLLGDEMGLGKTVQVIVFLAALQYSRVVSSHARYTGLGPTLIVVPATVIHQWVKHFHDWAPEFRVAVLHQSGSYTGNKSHLMKEINKCKGILITTYSGILKYKGYLSELPWHYLILDEGHKIRNHTAKVSIAVKQLSTPHRIMLTGSPMQNNLQELWSLFDFIVPGMLGNLTTFMEHVASPIMQGGYTNSTPMQVINLIWKEKKISHNNRTKISVGIKMAV